MSKHPTLFLDRDGTINVDLMTRYMTDPKDMALIPGAAAAIVKAKREGFKVSLITNQAGVAKGLIPDGALPKLHRHLEMLIANEGKFPGFQFDDIQVCPHRPEDKCACRKPQPGLLEASIKKLDSDPKRSFFIGDKSGDMLCAHACGVRSILVLTGHGEETREELSEIKKGRPMSISRDLTEAVEVALRSR